MNFQEFLTTELLDEYKNFKEDIINETVLEEARIDAAKKFISALDTVTSLAVEYDQQLKEYFKTLELGSDFNKLSIAISKFLSETSKSKI